MWLKKAIMHANSKPYILKNTKENKRKVVIS